MSKASREIIKHYKKKCARKKSIKFRQVRVNEIEMISLAFYYSRARQQTKKRQLIDHQLSFNLLILSLIFDKFFLVLSVSKRNRPWADVDEPAISLHGYPVSVSTSLLRFLIFPRHYKILQDFS